jgi:hypothetical protein
MMLCAFQTFILSVPIGWLRPSTLVEASDWLDSLKSKVEEEKAVVKTNGDDLLVEEKTQASLLEDQ